MVLKLSDYERSATTSESLEPSSASFTRGRKGCAFLELNSLGHFLWSGKYKLYPDYPSMPIKHVLMDGWMSQILCMEIYKYAKYGSNYKAAKFTQGQVNKALCNDY